jgi:molybdenum cofactor biosynthesis enzyme MoaA
MLTENTQCAGCDRVALCLDGYCSDCYPEEK